MSIQVTLPELAETLTRYTFAYLMSVGDDDKAYVVSVSTTIDGDTLLLTGAGRRAGSNLAARPSATLVYPPADPGEMSLIVDGIGSLRGEDVVVTFTGGVLHRPAPPAA